MSCDPNETKRYVSIDNPIPMKLSVSILSITARVSQAHIHMCQGERFDASGCLNPNSVIKIKSITILTNSNVTRIQEVSAGDQKGCFAAKQCQRTINSKLCLNFPTHKH